MPILALALSILPLVEIGCARQIVWLPSASDPRIVGLDDVSLPLPVLRTKDHTTNVWNVAFSPDGKRVYSSGDDKVVRVWDVESGAYVDELRIPGWTGSDGEIYALDVSPDGRLIAVGGCQGCSGKWADEDSFLVYVGDLESMEIVGSARAYASVHVVAFSPDGSRLATGGSDGRLRIFRVGRDDGLIEESTLPGHRSKIADLAWKQDQSGLFTVSHDGMLLLWSPHPAGGWFADWKVEHDVKLSAVAATPDGKWVVVAGFDGRLTLRDARDGAEVRDLLDFEDSHVMSLQTSADSKSIAYGSGAGSWEETGFGILSIPDAKQKRFAKGRNTSQDLAWHQGKENLLAVAEGSLGSVSIIDAERLRERIRLGGKIPEISGVASNGRSVAWNQGSEEEYRPNVFDTQKLALLPLDSEDEYRYWGENKIFNVKVNSPLNGYVSLTRRFNGTTWQIPATSSRIVSWSILNDHWIGLGAEFELVVLNTHGAGQRRRRCYGHSSNVNGVSPHGEDGKLLISGSSDRTIRFWNRRSCELLLTLFPSTDKEWVAWTPSGLYAASENGALLLGFHVNRGARQTPILYSSTQLPGLNRPDLILQILELATADGVEVSASDREIRE